MRTREQGLLTSADVAETVGVDAQLRRQAHGGAILASQQCEACTALTAALGNWIAAHTVYAEELAELEKRDDD